MYPFFLSCFLSLRELSEAIRAYAMDKCQDELIPQTYLDLERYCCSPDVYLQEVIVDDRLCNVTYVLLLRVIYQCRCMCANVCLCLRVRCALELRLSSTIAFAASRMCECYGFESLVFPFFFFFFFLT